MNNDNQPNVPDDTKGRDEETPVNRYWQCVCAGKDAYISRREFILMNGAED